MVCVYEERGGLMMMNVSLIVANIRRMGKDWKLLLGVFSLPLLAILAITILTNSSAGIQQISMGIVDKDGSPFAHRFIEEMKQDSYLAISIYDEASAQEKFIARKTPVILTIPEEFFARAIAGEAVQMGLMRMETVPAESVIERAQQIVRSLLREEVLAVFSDNSRSEDLASSVITLEVERMDRPPNRFLVISLIITFMMVSVIFMSHELIDLRRKRLFFRMYATPHKPRQLTGSLMGTVYILLAIQTIGLFVVGSIFMGGPLVEHNLVGTVVLMACFILLTLSLGVIIARVCKTPSMLGVWANLIILPTGMISGIFVPQEYLPDFLNNISFLAPQHWVMTGLQKMNAGEPFVSILPNVLVLLLFSACLFSFGIFRFDRLVKA